MWPLTRAAPAILAFLLGISSTARSEAQTEPPKDPKAEALRLFEESATQYRDGHFAEAAELLERAYKLHPEPVLLYNLGRAYDGLGENEKAVDAYKRYLELAPEAKDKGALERRIATLEKIIEREKQLKEEAERKKTDGQKPPEPPPAADSTFALPGIWPWVVTGVGAATIGAGLFVGLSAKSKRDDADENPVQRDAQKDFESAESRATTANILLIAGTVITAGGVTWGLLGSKKSEPAQSSKLHVTVRPGSLWLGGTL